MLEDRGAERKGYAEALKTKYTLVELSKRTVDLDILDNQRRLALALTKEYQAIAEYNNSLARVEFARGTIMQHDNVVIAENGLTPSAQVRAVDHERERTRALKLLERPDPLAQPALIAGNREITCPSGVDDAFHDRGRSRLVARRLYQTVVGAASQDRRCARTLAVDSGCEARFPVGRRQAGDRSIAAKGPAHRSENGDHMPALK